MKDKVSWNNTHDEGTNLSLPFSSLFPFSFTLLICSCLLFFYCCRFGVSWRNFHKEGNGSSLPFSSLPHLIFVFVIYLLMFIVVCFIAGLMEKKKLAFWGFY